MTNPTRSVDALCEAKHKQPRDGPSASMRNRNRNYNNNNNTDTNDPSPENDGPSHNDDGNQRRIVAVTGASGFVGSHLCEALLEHGYTVRACVRSLRPSKVDHLSELITKTETETSTTRSRGRLELCVADMSQRGAYDSAFRGCSAVFHVAGNFGTDYHSLWKKDATTAPTAPVDANASNEAAIARSMPVGRLPPVDRLLRRIQREEGNKTKNRKRDRQRQRPNQTLGAVRKDNSGDESCSNDSDSDEECGPSYDHAVYRSYVQPMEWLLESVRRHSGTIRTVVYTSSGAAGGTISAVDDEEEENWHDAAILENAYGQAKRDCERLLYEFCWNHNRNRNRNASEQTPPIIGISICPCIVLGPVMGSTVHDRVYQHRWSDMLRGRYVLSDHWEIADVRDIAEAQRLLAEAVCDNECQRNRIPNGTRVWIGSEPSLRIRSLLEWITRHNDYRTESRLDPLRQALEARTDSDSDSGNGSDSESIKSDSGSAGSGNGSRDDPEADATSCETPLSSPERNQPVDCGGGDGSSSSSSNSESSESSSDDDSFGVPDWDHNDRNQRTTTWSDPVVLLRECGYRYRPRTPWQTISDTTRSILERWEVLGADHSLVERCELYTVAEMDGCSEEMEWLEGKIRCSVHSTGGDCMAAGEDGY